jgi:uncharacterized membrane protein
MTLLLAGGIWATQSLIGCAGESIPVGGMLVGEGGAGGMDAEGGADEPAPGSGGRGGQSPAGQGGRNVGGRSGGTLNQGAFGNAAAEGGDPGIAGFAGSGAGFGQGGFAGTIAGYAGDAVGASGGTLGFSGSAGFGGAGSGGTAGTGGLFGYAGDTAAGSELIELPPVESAPCAQDVCTGAFEWRTAVVDSADYYVTDISGDGRVVIGHGAQGRAFRMSWDSSQMWMLVASSGVFPAEAASFNGELLVGSNRWVLGNGVPEAFVGVPDTHGAQGVSNDGSVSVATDAHTGSYVIRFGAAEPMEDYVFWTVGADGSTVGGERLTDGRAVVGDGEGSIEVLPVYEGWIPRAVNALCGNGDVAVGYATNPDSIDSAQAFRWERGSESLQLLGIPEGAEQSTARDCNHDGSIVVGFTSVDSALSGGFVYDLLSGLYTLTGYARKRAGVAEVSELQIDSIRISSNGARIAGGGFKGSTPIAFRQYFTRPIAPP